MAENQNIIVADESALHLYLHARGLDELGAKPAWGDPLEACASSSRELCDFNTNHPLFGGEPVCLLSKDEANRRHTSRIKVRRCSFSLPPKSFYQLRDGLYITSPELTFVRMAAFASETTLTKIGTNLCARYYIHDHDKELPTRPRFLTSIESIEAYIDSVEGMQGTRKARRALKRMFENSASPEETKTAIQFCNPVRCGSFALPFKELNYDFKIGRRLLISEQTEYSLDLANPVLKEAIEYDGKDSHKDPGKDKRRRNALAALGWRVYPIDRSVLYNPDETVRFAHQMAKIVGIRIRRPADWESRFIELRKDLGLPV